MGMDSLDGSDNFDDATPIMKVNGGHNVYAMCFRNNGDGRLSIGGADPSLHTAPFAFTPLLFDTSLSVAVNGITVADQAVDMRHTEVTLDSGTTVLLLPRTIYIAVRAAFPTSLE